MNTYKKEFTVARWSEVKPFFYITYKGSVFDDVRGMKEYHISKIEEVAWSNWAERNQVLAYNALHIFMFQHKIDFINFDE